MMMMMMVMMMMMMIMMMMMMMMMMIVPSDWLRNPFQVQRQVYRLQTHHWNVWLVYMNLFKR
jgi:hypothetical protein